MTVEKMHLVNITSRLSNLRDLLIDVINIGQIEPVDAFNQVASRAFSVKASTENVELTEDMNSIKSFEGLSKSDIEKITYLKTLLESDDSINDSCKKAISKEDLEDLYKNLAPIIKRKEELLEKRKELLDFKGNLDILDKAEIDIEKMVPTARKMLEEIIQVQMKGDFSKGEKYVMDNFVWTPEMEKMAQNIKTVSKTLNGLV